MLLRSRSRWRGAHGRRWTYRRIERLAAAGCTRVTQIRKLLVPMDGSPGGLLALQMADAIANSTGASIKIVEIAVPIPMLAYAAPYDPSGLGFYDSAWDDDALPPPDYVAAVAERLHGRGRSVEAEASMAPSVAESIVDAADSCDTDMIVISTHAVTGPARAILGSVADGVVRMSSAAGQTCARSHIAVERWRGRTHHLRRLAESVAHRGQQSAISHQESLLKADC